MVDAVDVEVERPAGLAHQPDVIPLLDRDSVKGQGSGHALASRSRAKAKKKGVGTNLEFVQTKFTVFPAGSFAIGEDPTATHHDCT